MSQKSTNIYQRAREIAGITQERAAELIGLSVESIKAYENEHRIPPESAVLAMIEVYNNTRLALQHLRYASTIGNKLLPDIKEKALAEAVCGFLVSIPDDIDSVKNELIKIASDGVIDDTEREKFDVLMENLDRMVKGIFELKIHNESGGLL